MGKADVLVVLLGLASLIAIGWLLMRAVQALSERAHERHVQELIRTTPWRQYLDVGENGEFIIGVQRAAEGHTFGRHEMARLPVGTAPLDVQLKISEAKDRATIYNNTEPAERR